MTRMEWEAQRAGVAQANLARRAAETRFNQQIVDRVRAGEAKEWIICDLRITRELFNRAMRNARHPA